MQHRISGYLPWEGMCFFSGPSHSCGGNVQLLQSKDSGKNMKIAIFHAAHTSKYQTGRPAFSAR